MDTESVRGYINQVGAEYDAVDRVATDAFHKGLFKGGLDFSFADWRRDYLNWGKWVALTNQEYWLGTDEYNTTRQYHELCKTWRARMGKLTEGMPSAPVPERDKTTEETISSALGGAATAVALLGAGLILWSIRRER